MGADLFINLVSSQNDGYFRDSYGDAVLWKFGLSWWKDVIPMLDESQNLPVAQIQILLEQLNERAPLFEALLKGIPGRHRQYFRKRATELRRFLEEAIKLNSSIHCSL